MEQPLQLENSRRPELWEHRDGCKERLDKVNEGFEGAMKKYQIYGQMIAEMAKKRSSEAFYALDDPLEAAVF